MGDSDSDNITQSEPPVDNVRDFPIRSESAPNAAEVIRVDSSQRHTTRKRHVRENVSGGSGGNSGNSGNNSDNSDSNSTNITATVSAYVPITQTRRYVHEVASERMGRVIHNPRRVAVRSLRRLHRAPTITSMDLDARYQKLLAEKEKQLNIKASKIENNNSWSSETEAIVAEVGEKAQGYVWMHNRNASYLVDWDTRYSNVEIILSILTGTSVFTTINDCQELSLVTLVTGIIIYMTAVIRAIHQNRKYPEQASAHRLAASKYSEIYHSVQKQLALYRRDRENAKDYINWITEKFDTLLLSSPGMDDPIKEEYLIKFKDVKFMHPGDLKQIEIKKETSGSGNSDKIPIHRHKHDNCSEFSSDYEMSDAGHQYNSGLHRSITLRSPMVSQSNNKVDKKMQYELARYTMR